MRAKSNTLSTISKGMTDSLPQNTIDAIAENLALIDVAPARSARVKAALLAWSVTATSMTTTRTTTATETEKNISTHHAFNAADSGGGAKWRVINPLVSMQILHDDGETLSWYARFQPGGRLPAHDHTGDEESLVISGSCYLNDKLMQVGDYQVCRAGSRHDNVHSEHGCMLFIRTPKAMLRSHAHAY